MPYYQKSSGLKVPSMMICGLPSVDEEFLQFEDNAMKCGILSSTLQKLYMWEKKLVEEIKIHGVMLEREWCIDLPNGFSDPTRRPWSYSLLVFELWGQ
ncbi:hypothetical protein ABZP36_000630 [Zizania latifolia]